MMTILSGILAVALLQTTPSAPQKAQACVLQRRSCDTQNGAADLAPGTRLCVEELTAVVHGVRFEFVAPVFREVNTEAAARFNTAIQDLFDQQVAKLGQVEPSDSVESRDSDEDGASGDISLRCRNSTTDPELFTVVCYGESYFHGAAHPNHFSRSLSFSLSHGKVVALRDLFLPDSDYVAVLSALSIDRLLAQPGFLAGSDLAWLQRGAGPSERNFQDWAASPNGLTITFDEYVVACYAVGGQQVMIPWSQLATLIDPCGPAAHFVAKQ